MPSTMQASVHSHPKRMAKAGLSRRSKSPEALAPMSSTVNHSSSSRTRVHPTELDAKTRNAQEAARRQAKTLEADETNYGTTIQRTSISSACSPNVCRYNEDKLLRYELEGMPHRGIPFQSFTHILFPNHEDIDGLCTDFALVEQCRRKFLHSALVETNEKAMYEPFVALVTSILELVEGSEIAYIDYHLFPPRGAVKHAERCPDGVFVHKRADGSFPPPRKKGSLPSRDDLQWNEILIPVELKRDVITLLSDSGFLSTTKWSYSDLQERLRNLQSRIDLNPREQVASYALEALSASVLKRFTLGLLVVNDLVELWYFDRAGPLGSTMIELRKDDDFASFVNVIAAIASASPIELGFDPCFSYEGPWPYSPIGCLVTIPSSDPAGAPFVAKVASNQPIDLSRCLSGRGTRVIPVYLSDAADFKTYVMKLAWQPPSRMAEAELYQLAGNIQGLPKIISSGELGALSDGVRGRLESFLPSRKSLPGDRVLRVLVMPTKFSRILGLTTGGKARRDKKTLLGQPDKLLVVMSSLLSVHRTLHERGILHRDLNPGNLMWQQEAAEKSTSRGKTVKSYKVQGFLIDLDYASGPQSSPTHASDEVPYTFSTPFLAIDLLSAGDQPQLHRYRHDLESFYWSIVWLVLSFHDVTSLGAFALEEWQVGSKSDIMGTKDYFLRRLCEEVFEKLQEKVPTFKPVVDVLKRLSDIIRSGHDALKLPDADKETAGGHITFEAFQGAVRC